MQTMQLKHHRLLFFCWDVGCWNDSSTCVCNLTRRVPGPLSSLNNMLCHIVYMFFVCPGRLSRHAGQEWDRGLGGGKWTRHLLSHSNHIISLTYIYISFMCLFCLSLSIWPWTSCAWRRGSGTSPGGAARSRLRPLIVIIIVIVMIFMINTI